MRTTTGTETGGRTVRRVLAAALLLVAAGCGGSDRQGAVGGAPLLTPAEADGRAGLVAVQGFLWARPGDNVFRLCDAVLESFPPQCGEPAVAVTGLDVTGIAGIEFSQNVFWAEGVRARGDLADGTLAAEAVELSSSDDVTGISFRLVVPVEATAGPLDFVAYVTNGALAPTDLRFPDGQSAEVILALPDTGAEVFRWSSGRTFDQAVRDVVLQPGESRRFVLSTESLGLEPGVYDLTTRLTAEPPTPAAEGRLVVR